MQIYKSKVAWILGGFEYLHADDVIADPGAGGATFRTDQLGTGQHVPYTKLMDGTADGTAVIPGDATNGLYVQVKTSALPSGAATAAKQPALGTAGSASSDVISVQGIASMTALKVDPSAVTSPISAASLPLPSGAATAANQSTEITSLQLIDDIVQTDDAAFTPATSKVAMVGAEFDDTTPDSVDEGDGGALRMSGRRELYTQLRDAAGNERGANVTAANALKVDASSAAVPVTDNSGSLTIDTAQLPSSLGQTNMAGSVSVALASNQSALPITDNSGSLTVDNGGTFAVQESGAALTALQLIDNLVLLEDAVAGSGDPGVAVFAVRRDVASAGAADGDYVNLSTDSTGALRVTGGGGGTQYQEDTAHTTGDTGTLSLAVRRDANTTLVDATGDYAPLQVDASGGLKVSIIAGAGSGGTASTDDAAFTVASGSGTPAMGLFNDSTPDSVDEGDVGVMRMSANRNQYVTIRDSAGNERGVSVTAANALKVDASGAAVPITDNSGSLTVDGTVAISSLPASTNTLEVVGDVAHDAVAAGNPVLMGAYASASAPTNVSADGDAVRVWADLAGRVQVGDGGGSLSIDDGAGSITVDNGGTFAVQATIASGATSIAKAEDVASADADVGVPAMAVRKATPANTSGTDGDYEMLQMSAGRLWVDASGVSLTVASHAVTNAGTFAVQAGQAAHDAAVSGNPVRAGGRARTSDYTAVVNDDTSDFVTDLNGKLIVLPYAIPENSLNGVTAAITGTGDTSVIAAQGAGVRIYVTQVVVTNSHATVGTVVEIKDGTTVIQRGYAAPAGGGFALSFPIPLRLTANTALNAANITTASNTYVSASGFKAV